MFCVQCGQKSPEQAKFCSSCGHSLEDGGGNLGVPPTPPESKRSLPGLFKWLLAITLIGVVFALFLLLSSDDPKRVIKEQLRALGAHNITEAYYAYTAKEFQSATSLEDFKEFIREHPILSSKPEETFEDGGINDSAINYKGSLITKDLGRLSVEYQLIKEGSEWKILSIQIEQNETKKPALPPFAFLEREERSKGFALAQNEPGKEEVEKESLNFTSEEIDQAAAQFMEALKAENLNDAYEKTSVDFKREIPLDEFEKFVAFYPIFIHYESYEFPKFEIKNKVIILKGTLKGKGESSYKIEMQLVKEGAQLKVLHLKIDPNAPPKKKLEAADGEESFTKLVAGMAIDDKGKIVDPTLVLPPSQKEIYVNLFYQGGVKGTLVTLLFRHKESNSQVTPVSAFYEKDGTGYLTFVFSPPPNGWPKGTYEIKAFSSKGAKGNYSFTVE